MKKGELDVHHTHLRIAHLACAVQVNINTPSEVYDFCQRHEIAYVAGYRSGKFVIISETASHKCEAHPGDWIVADGERGDVYVLADKTFAQRYTGRVAR